MATRKDERIVTFDYDELSMFSETVCELVPLSQKDVSVLVSCLRVAHWVARWFAGDKLLRELGRFTDIEDALTYIENLERKLLMSGCLEGLIAVMSEIRDAIRAQVQCCLQGSNPYQMIDIGEGNYAFGTELPLTDPPEGEFENEEAYRQNRCDAANVIVSDLVSAFNQFGVVTLASIVAGGLVVAGVALVTVPPVGIFYALALAGFLFGACELISNYIDDHRQELVCMLYNAESYADWEIAYRDWVEAMAIELEIGGFTIDLTNLFRSLVSTDAYNKMFTTLGFPVPDDAVDCANCEPSAEYHWELTCGTAEWQEGLIWRVTGVQFAPWQRYSFLAQLQDVNDDPVTFTISDFTLVSGTSPEWYSYESGNWQNFPISSSYEFTDGNIQITFDTQGELHDWVADITISIV